MTVGASWYDTETGVGWGPQRRPSLGVDLSFARLSKQEETQGRASAGPLRILSKQDETERVSTGPLRIKRTVQVFAWTEKK